MRQLRAGLPGLSGVSRLLCALQFGRRQTREHSRYYLQALLVQTGERRNAENLSETVPAGQGDAAVSHRGPWDDAAPRRACRNTWDPTGTSGGGVGAGRQRLPQAGQEVGGSGPAVLRQTGPEGGQLPGRNVPGLRQSLGRALVDKGLYLPESWTSDKDRCAAAGPPEQRQGYRSKTELALELLERARRSWASGPSGSPEAMPSGCRRPSGRDWRP